MRKYLTSNTELNIVDRLICSVKSLKCFMEYLLFREKVPSNLVAAMGPSVSICIPQETTTTSLRIKQQLKCWVIIPSPLSLSRTLPGLIKRSTLVSREIKSGTASLGEHKSSDANDICEVDVVVKYCLLLYSFGNKENNEGKEILLNGKNGLLKYFEFVVCELQSVLIFSFLDRPCSFMVY